jgi:SIR2-like domain
MQVIFLGAGSSKALGLLTTGELLPKIIDSARSNELFAGDPEAGSKRSEVLQFLSELVPGFPSKSMMPSIVDLLSLIDFALAEGFTVFQSGGTRKLRQCRERFEEALLHVLGDARWSHFGVESLKEAFSQTETTVITTNYDLLPDMAIQSWVSTQEPIDYGMVWRDTRTGLIHRRPSTPKVALFKLHGSLNWLGCPFCEHIYISPGTDIAFLDVDADSNVFREATTCHCGYSPLRRVIVSPSLSRGSYQTPLRAMHLAAIESLRLAERIYIVGYSLPMEDLFIRSLFLRSVAHSRQMPAVRIYQISEEAKPRYEMLFRHFEYFTSGFEGLIEEVTGRSGGPG